MNHSLLSFVAIGAIALASAVSAATVRVSQESSAGAGDFDANILGFVQTFDVSATGTVADFYNYGSPGDAFSYNGDDNGGPVAFSSFTQSFVVIGTDGVALVTVHDNPSDGSGGSAYMTHTVLGGVGGGVDLMVRDDPNDTYITTDAGGDRSFTTQHDWLSCCTDGSAIGDLGLNFTVFSQFDVAATGLTDWFVRGGADNDILVDGSVNRRVRFDIVNQVPIPASGVLLVGAFGAIAAVKRRRKTA